MQRPPIENYLATVLPEQEASLTLPCSNLRSFRSKCTVLNKTLLELFGSPRRRSAPSAVIWLPRSDSVPGESRPPCPPRYAPDCAAEIYCERRLGERFFVFNCCKKDQNIAVDFSERTSFGTVETVSASSKIVGTLKNCFFSRLPAFFLKRTSLCVLAKSVCKLYALACTFYKVHVPYYCCVPWYETRTAFLSSFF